MGANQTRWFGKVSALSPDDLEMLMARDPSPVAAELARALRAHRKDIAGAFAAALASTPKWKALIEAKRPQWDDFVRTEFFAFVDYLIEYFGRGDDTFQQLFLGEKIKSLYDTSLDPAAREKQAREVGIAERSQLQALLSSRLSASAWQLLDEHLSWTDRLLRTPAQKTQRVLLVGDCIFLDILPFVVGPLLEAGVAVVPEYAASKNPLDMRERLRKLSTEKFDLVFFSPFSYEFVPEYAQLAQWRGRGRSDAAVREIVQRTWRETQLTLELIADLFDCPVHVHNSSAVVREENAAKRLVKQRATAHVRGVGKREVNRLLAEHVQRHNAQSFKQLFVLDEDALASAFDAGAYYYRTALQHPAVLGRILAERYVDIVYVNAQLVKKKLVVCDLDNTLWSGVIGEGAVRHHHERQELLKGLKAKGVVLAINSKNDPANVHWQGGSLCDDDFVCAAISWDPKVQGMKRIQSVLNLKMKDYVFVDDRADERELMRLAYPEVLCLDADDERVWKRLAMWRDALDDDLEMDRTLMYKQREQRKAFIKEDVASADEKLALFKSLDLRLAITHAAAGDLKRVAELINRTNQFNLEGSRTSFKEVADWHESPDHVILTGQSSDRFGDMGTTCVAVARIDAGEMVLLPFVLSCRVFGYGIETSVLNCLKDIAQRLGVGRIVARYLPTPQNAPCKDFLRDNGFSEDGGRWIFAGGAATPADPPWLRVTRPEAESLAPQ